jgi:hypothetical protein
MTVHDFSQRLCIKVGPRKRKRLQEHLANVFGRLIPIPSVNIRAWLGIRFDHSLIGFPEELEKPTIDSVSSPVRVFGIIFINPKFANVLFRPDKV